MFNQTKTDVGSIPQAGAPGAAVPSSCPHSPGTQEPLTAPGSGPALLGNPPVQRSPCAIGNSADLAAFAPPADGEVT